MDAIQQTDPIGAVIDRLCHTREELAQKLGVSPAALYSWSVGRRSPRPANRTELAKIARAHARELADLASVLEGPGRRTMEPMMRADQARPDPLSDRHRVWRTELKEIQARAVETRLKARHTLGESRRVGETVLKLAEQRERDRQR
jgi:hypothetical protein